MEALGFLNPHTKEKNLKADRIKYWLEKGAQCSDTVHNLLVKEGVVAGPKRPVKMKKKEELNRRRMRIRRKMKSGTPGFASKRGQKKEGGEKKEVKAGKADPDEKKEKEAPAGAKPEKK